MIEKEALIGILKSHAELHYEAMGIQRDLLDKVTPTKGFARVLTGVRRSGKSTLLRQYMHKNKQCHFLNFEDPLLAAFALTDYDKLLESCKELGNFNLFCFDEIHNFTGWERMVRGLLDLNKNVILTGSTASILSRELGTKLTGRHLDIEVFPFSYGEFLHLRHLQPHKESFLSYLACGGFPQYLQEEHTAILTEHLLDILARDVLAKKDLRDERMLKEFALFLLSSFTKEISYNSLKNTFQLGSPNTAKNYLEALENAYLLFTIPLFDFSYKRRIRNTRKVYAIDNALVKTNMPGFSPDTGRYFENAVFLHLRRTHKDISYYRRNHECDFIIRDGGWQAIQACSTLSQDNLKRELDGIHEAMDELKLKKGLIITLDKEDTFGNVWVVPAWKWMLEKKPRIS